jgi:hypothetical protein
MAFGSGSTTVPSTRIVSSLGLATGHHRGLGARKERAEGRRGDQEDYLRAGPEGNLARDSSFIAGGPATGATAATGGPGDAGRR